MKPSPSADLRRKLAAFAPLPISFLPTPLQPLPRLSSRFPGHELLLKRDDQTGLAFGGNKARKLDFILADARRRGADTVVTWGGLQSNWCRQVAAAAPGLGMRAVLLLLENTHSRGRRDGNAWLDELLAAEVHRVRVGRNQKTFTFADIEPLLSPLIESAVRRGSTPYAVSVGGSQIGGSMQAPLGALAYVQAMAELLDQLGKEGRSVDTIVVPTGSGSTLAGLWVGKKLLCPRVRLIGISVTVDGPEMLRLVRPLAVETLAALGEDTELADAECLILDDYLAGGYGVLDPATAAAIRLLAREEGVLFDPVYTGKAMAGLLDLLGSHRLELGRSILFWHTGGTPALFAYRRLLQP